MKKLSYLLGLALLITTFGCNRNFFVNEATSLDTSRSSICENEANSNACGTSASSEDEDENDDSGEQTQTYSLDDADVIASGTNADSSTSLTEVITSTADFEAAWAEHIDEDTTPSAVDFDSYVVAMVLMGSQNTGGYTTEITGYTESDTQITINITEHSPGSDCMVTQALTTPYFVAQIPLADKEYAFEISEETYDCN